MEINGPDALCTRLVFGFFRSKVTQTCVVQTGFAAFVTVTGAISNIGFEMPAGKDNRAYRNGLFGQKK